MRSPPRRAPRLSNRRRGGTGSSLERGRLAARLGRTPEAVECATQCITLGVEGSAYAYKLRAECTKAVKPEDAARDYEEALRREGLDPDSRAMCEKELAELRTRRR